MGNQHTRLHTQASPAAGSAQQSPQVDHQPLEPASAPDADFFRSLIEHSPDMIVVIQPSGTIQYSSPAVEATLGYRAEDIIGTHVQSLIHASDIRRVRKQFVAILKHPGTTIAFEVRVQHKDGSWHTLEAMSKAYHGTTGTQRITAHMRDVTPRKQMEDWQQRERFTLTRRIAERTMELSAANIELARSAQLKDAFLASISHELRTPLNIILGFSEALQENVYGALPPRQLQAIDAIASNGQHLLVLINDMLDLSKLEAGTLTVQLAPIDIAGVCQSSLQMIRQEAEQKNIQITFNQDPAVTHMLADKVRIKQMLFHLLSNAVKFTPADSAIGLDVLGDLEHNIVRFSVWDRGIGIAAEHLQYLFQPFVQLDSGLARQYNGAGLGLVLVNRLVELHNGGVAVESEVGHGSRFTLWLPWRTMTTELYGVR